MPLLVEALDCLLFFGGGSAIVVSIVVSGAGDSEYSSLESSCSFLIFITELETDAAPSCFLVCTQVETLWERLCCTGTFEFSLLSVVIVAIFPVLSCFIPAKDSDEGKNIPDLDLLPGRLISLSGENLMGFLRVLLYRPLFS